MAFLKYVPPMGIYETLYAFLAAVGKAMGDPGTHPWSQGFPRMDQLPGGPPMPTTITVAPDHLKYPKAWGLPACARRWPATTAPTTGRRSPPKTS